MLYPEIDYFYDGILCSVICVDCIDSYKKENAEYTDIETIDAVKYWEGPALICDCCNIEILSEYGDPCDDKLDLG